MPVVYVVGAVLVLAVVLLGLALLAAFTVLAGVVGVVVTALATLGFVVVAICRDIVAVLRDDRHGHLQVAPPDPLPPGRDPGYLSYYFGPAWRDYALATSRGAAAARDRTIVRHAVEARSVLDALVVVWESPDELEEWPALLGKVIVGGAVLGGLVGLAVGGVAAGVFLAITSVTFGVLLGTLIAVLSVICAALRVFELGVLRLRGITVECPSCHRGVGVPVYECPACQELHRRLVPGSLGVLSRTCRCGQDLPTLLVGGRSRLRAHCGHESCRGVLPLGGLTVPTRHIPVVAGKAAGKTVHTMAAIAELKSGQAGAGFAFGDEHTETTYAEVEAALRDVSSVPTTLPSTALRAATFFLGRNGRRRLVYLYDAAGESYQTSERVSGLRFLGSTAGALLIVDVLALPPVRKRMEDDGVPLPPHSTESPGDVIGRFTQGLREHTARRVGTRVDVAVAVVLTKCDLLVDGGSVRHPFEGVPLDAPSGAAERSDAVAHWMDVDAGEGGLVRQLRNDFSRIAFFAVSALDAFGAVDRPSARTGLPVRNDAPSAPLRWLLAADLGAA